MRSFLALDNPRNRLQGDINETDSNVSLLIIVNKGGEPLNEKLEKTAVSTHKNISLVENQTILCPFWCFEKIDFKDSQFNY